MNILLNATNPVLIVVPVAIIVILAIIVACMFVSYHNKFIKLRNNVEESFSSMDVYLKKRYDLIPNLVSTVKGYAKHEQETLTQVIEARNMCINATTAEEKIQSENMLNDTLKSLFALSENYPKLQANENFIDLQNQLKVIEEDIAVARKTYNARVKTYNTSIEVFPGFLFAKLYKHKKVDFFVVDEEKERKNIKVEF